MKQQTNSVEKNNNHMSTTQKLQHKLHQVFTVAEAEAVLVIKQKRTTA